MRGNRGILSWRADGQPASAGKGNRANLKRAKADRADAGVRTKVQKAGAGAPSRPTTFVLYSLLKPREAQKNVLDAIFSGPVLLRKLLADSGVQPRTAEEAGLFLLQHRKALQPYLYASDRTKSVELLKKLVLDWARSSPELIELELPADCSISAGNEVFLPIPKLGLLPVADIEEMQTERKGRRYSPSFILIHSPWGYIAEIELHGVKRAEPKAPVPTVQRPNIRPLAKVNRTSDRIRFDQFMAIFDNALDARLMNELRVASGYVKPDFDALQGRPVRGGLPSLGKGR